MRTRLLFRAAIAAALLASLTGCVVAPVGPYYGDYPVTVAPPPQQYEVIGAPPLIGHIWIGGHWRWGGRAHVWAPGYWQAPRYGYRWAPHAWVQGRGGWREAPGRWQRY